MILEINKVHKTRDLDYRTTIKKAAPLGAGQSVEKKVSRCSCSQSVTTTAATSFT